MKRFLARFKCDDTVWIIDNNVPKKKKVEGVYFFGNGEEYCSYHLKGCHDFFASERVFSSRQALGAAVFGIKKRLNK